jgi:tetratricopeptide (TPR) repeat protein
MTWGDGALPDVGMSQVHASSRRPAASLLALAVFAAACQRAVEGLPAAAAGTAEPLRLALAEHGGRAAIDYQIRAAQGKVRDKADVPRLERLATLFIGKARSSGDPGYYKQAEACADAMPAADGGAAAALLVRGHVRHALHDFAGAERIARQLISSRDLFLDQGLLGDVLLDRGRLDEARDAYQRMMQLKPCLQSYARAAQLRWLAGDHAGTRELLGLAATAGSQRDPESLAWVQTRLATLELQAGDAAAAMTHADRALGLVADYPAALLARGRAQLARGAAVAALTDLTTAAAASPLPEHLWAAADAARAAGQTAAAGDFEARLLATGEREDPRTFAVWLATTGRDTGAALRLAAAEFAVRQDALTHDALAVARWRAGDLAGAQQAMRLALAGGLRDARVSLHAALLAEATGDRDALSRHRRDAGTGRTALLPSECALLDALARRS